MHILIAIFALATAWAAPRTASVERARFQVGNTWTWLYSEWNAPTAWTPYYVETYRVAEVNDAKLTIEMTSAPPGVNPEAPHHKFVLDFAKCERAAADPAYKNFTVTLYTRSLGPGWQLASASHGNRIFTEKFNCASAFPRQPVTYQTFGGDAIFHVETHLTADSSFYYLDRSDLRGVAATKLFQPGGRYKFEFAGATRSTASYGP